MRAATFKQPSKDTAPVFVAGGRHRSHAVRLAAAAFGLLLAGWLAAIAAGLIGFSPLPELTLSRPGGAETAPAPPTHGPRTVGQNVGSAQTSLAASGTERGSADASAASRGVPGAPSGEAQETGSASASAGGGAPSPGSDNAAPQPQPTSPAGGAAAPDQPGQPSFTPRASGEQAASPPRGSSASAPGRTVSADPPRKAAGPPSG